MKTKKFFRCLIAFCFVILTLMNSMSAMAASVGSSADDISIGEDTVQGVKTEYNVTSVGSANTNAYLTVDNSQVIVSVPTTVILSGGANADGEYIGKYSVKVKGDISGDETLVVQPDNDVLKLSQTGKSDVNATIQQDKIDFVASDLESESITNGVVTADGLTAGSWTATTHFNIYISNNISETKYTHNALLYSDDRLYSGARNAIVMYDVDGNSVSENRVFNIETEKDEATYMISGLAEKDNYLYASCRQEVAGMSYNENNETIGDLYILNKDDLSLVNKIDLGWKGSRVIIDGDLMIVNLQMKGFNIYKLDDPTNPELIYSYQCNGDQEFQDGEIVRHNDKIYYVSAGFGFGLYVFDITDTVNSDGDSVVTRVGYMPFSYYKNSTPALYGLHIYDVVVDYPYIYCSIAPTSTSMLNTEKDVRGIMTVNLEDVIKYTVSSKIPFVVTEIPEQYKICQGMSGDLQPTFMACHNGYIYTSIGYRGIAVFDTRNQIPEFEELIDTSNRNIRPVCVDVENNILYGASGVGDQYKDILHFDVSNFS